VPLATILHALERVNPGKSIVRFLTLGETALDFFSGLGFYGPNLYGGGLGGASNHNHHEKD
jgi:hypothetical protein